MLGSATDDELYTGSKLEIKNDKEIHAV